MSRSASLTRRDRGATAVEYGIMLALIAAVVIGVVSTLGQAVVALFDTAVGKF